MITPIKNTLRTLFDQYFQGDEDFSDFLYGNLEGKSSPRYAHGKSIYVADQQLKEYLSFIKFAVTSNLRIVEQAVFSYRKDVNIAHAVAIHAESRHFFQSDLKDFFPSIDMTLVGAAIQRSACAMPFSDVNDHIERIAQLTTVENKLPPGFSTSPALSNAALYEFDEVFLAYCNSRGLKYTRYSDDIIVSGSDKDTVAAASKAKNIFFIDLYGKKFSFNSSKTKFSHIGRKIKLLGMNILPNGLVVVDAKIRNKIETLLHSYSSDPLKFIELSNNDASKGVQSLSGYLNFVHCVDERYILKLKKKYGALFIEGFLSNNAPSFHPE